MKIKLIWGKKVKIFFYVKLFLVLFFNLVYNNILESFMFFKLRFLRNEMFLVSGIFRIK